LILTIDKHCECLGGNFFALHGWLDVAGNQFIAAERDSAVTAMIFFYF
jgi:hypothetical protein